MERIDAGERRVDIAGADAHHRDPAAVHLGAQAFHPGDGGRLGGAVGAVPRQAAESGHAGDPCQGAAADTAHGRCKGGQGRRQAGDIDLEHLPQARHVLERLCARAGGDAGVGDHQVRHAGTRHEILGRAANGCDVRHVGAVAERLTFDLAPGEKSERASRRGIVPRQRFADTRRRAGEENVYFAVLARSMSLLTDSSMPSREPPCSALTVNRPCTAMAGVPSIL